MRDPHRQPGRARSAPAPQGGPDLRGPDDLRRPDLRRPDLHGPDLHGISRARPNSLRLEGRARVLKALQDAGRASRPQLERSTGLSRATVAALTADLMDAGVVVQAPSADAEVGPGRAGRRAQLLSIRPEAAFAVGADIGHQQVRVVLCDASGSPVWERVVHMDVDRMPEAALDGAAGMVKEAMAVSGSGRALGLGVGIACPVDMTTGHLASRSIMRDWSGVQPAHELEARTGLASQVINDANAGALAEHLYGAARGCGNFLYVRLSPGIGAGIVTNGQLLLGAHGLTGEIGHLPVVPGGQLCRCGNRGCLETVASPVAIASLVSAGWRRNATADELLSMLEAGDPVVVRAVEDAGEAVGRCVAEAVTLLDPEMVVVGGELAAAGPVLFAAMVHGIHRHRMPSRAGQVGVVAGALGDHASARGAAGVVLGGLPAFLAGVAG